MTPGTSPGTIVVRRARDADAAAIAGLVNAAFAQYRGRLVPEAGALAESAASIAAHLAMPAGAAVALRTDDGGGLYIAGTVLFRPEGPDLYLGRLSVPPHGRGRGVAGALVRFVEDEARRRGCPGIVLGVRIALPDNQRLFRRHGFAEVSRHAHDGYDTPTWIRMRKPLCGVL
jgi:ribosomal protein S18 acetylase RimI-like enzyme